MHLKALFQDELWKIMQSSFGFVVWLVQNLTSSVVLYPVIYTSYTVSMLVELSCYDHCVPLCCWYPKGCHAWQNNLFCITYCMVILFVSTFRQVWRQQVMTQHICTNGWLRWTQRQADCTSYCTTISSALKVYSRRKKHQFAGWRQHRWQQRKNIRNMLLYVWTCVLNTWSHLYATDQLFSQKPSALLLCIMCEGPAHLLYFRGAGSPSRPRDVLFLLISLLCNFYQFL
jgi:hypothetical protein